jgi:hypothetical protein
MNKLENKILNIQIEKPGAEIGSIVYVPQKDRMIQSKIRGYEFLLYGHSFACIEHASGYIISDDVWVARGCELRLTDIVGGLEFYTNGADAEKAGKFIEVNASEEEWDFAIGKSPVKAENVWGPYSREKPEFRLCGTWTPDARDKLVCCRKQGGLLAYNRDWLGRIIDDDEEPFKNFNWDGPLGRIFKQLEVSPYVC